MAPHIGRRLRKGAATTAVAAAAVAALSASQAPGVAVGEQNRAGASDAHSAPEATGSDQGGATGNSPYYTDLPPLNSPNPAPSASAGAGTPLAQGAAEAGIPATVLDAYKKAEAELAASKPGCNLPWQLLAAIGKVESGHARGGQVDANGRTTSAILGPQLDGNGFALIKDTDNGEYDGNSSYDQAVGPMQFIPSTWAWAGRDGNGDGLKDPNNVYDAALAAGHYLCRNDWDLSAQGDLDRAILSYNNSREYLTTVLSWLEYYRKGTHEIPDGTGGVPSGRSDDGGTGSTAPSIPSLPSVPATPGTPSRPSTPPTTTPPPTAPPTAPPTTPPPTTPPTTPPPTPTDTVDHLADGGTAKLTARAGEAFTKKISTKAETKAGKAVGKVRIRFTVVGDSDTVFTGGESVATVTTDASGTAVAPTLQAGEKTGEVVIRATVVGRSVTGLDYRATVTERVADAVVRTDDTALTCVPGGEFADRVEVRATYKGAVAEKVGATATLVTSADDATANTEGPFFKDAEGNPVRTLTGLVTDAKGVLRLPELYADDTEGTFLLKITTAGGATLTVELTVAAADSPASPSPSASPSA
ncbi:lytic transglycosylase domain-containing protein [Streptomyces griseoviridis]